MAWHLSQIRRIVRVPQDGWNSLADIKWTYYYNFDGGALVTNKDIRAPEEALKRVFGFRPWVWQQWALVSIYCHRINRVIRNN